jgi:hypothetical protein
VHVGGDCALQQGDAPELERACDCAGRAAGAAGIAPEARCLDATAAPRSFAASAFAAFCGIADLSARPPLCPLLIHFTRARGLPSRSSSCSTITSTSFASMPVKSLRSSVLHPRWRSDSSVLSVVFSVK